MKHSAFIFICASLLLTGCANLSEVRFGWDFKNNMMTVSVPLSKTLKDK